ncbi:MAG TPA: WXG100 family type VII secretion target [Candidatus Limnocylindrales bacterium]|nr:WXG100 family type VII secretion target [Candidatus Limnocylindrales bacterium]
MEYFPADELKPPKAELQEKVEALHYITPSFWLGKFAKEILGQNPWEEAGRMIAGDWQSVEKTADAIKNLAEFNETYANALDKETFPLFQSHWRGKAAIAAGEYFRDLHGTLRAQAKALKGLAKQVKELAETMFNSAMAIKGLLDTLTDLLATAGISAAVSLGVKATVAIAAAVTKWKELVKFYDVFQTKVKELLGLISAKKVEVDSLRLDSISKTAYDYPGIRQAAPAAAPRQSVKSPSGGPKFGGAGHASVWDWDWE